MKSKAEYIKESVKAVFNINVPVDISDKSFIINNWFVIHEGKVEHEYHSVLTGKTREMVDGWILEIIDIECNYPDTLDRETVIKLKDSTSFTGILYKLLKEMMDSYATDILNTIAYEMDKGFGEIEK